jgi:hypothetical protein
MRRAGQKRPLSVRAIPAAPSVTTLNIVTFDDAPINAASNCPEELDEHEARRRALEVSIYQRIESRLSGRVRNLMVRVFEGVVTLEGECATYYTKQLAQHTAMGILEDEHLENSIIVRVH